MGEELNQWVIDKLNASNWSISKLGREAGLDQSNISKVLSGKRKPALDFYLKIAQAFDAVPEMLRAAGILSQADEDDITFGELYRAIKSLSREDRQHLNDYVDFLIEQDKKRKAARARAITDPAKGHV